MNAGQAITLACHEQRIRDFRAIRRSIIMHGNIDNIYRLDAWMQWGWDIDGHGGLGRAGFEPLPFARRRQARRNKADVKAARAALAKWYADHVASAPDPITTSGV